MLVSAYEFAIERERHSPTLVHVRHLAAVVEPITGGRFRHVPVAGAGSHRDVPAAVERLWQGLDNNTPVDQFVKAFLAIHPFVDGNGRLAFILHNWLSGTLADPHPLPDYFG